MAEVNEKEYPKWIDHPTNDRGTTRDGKRIPERVLVQNAKEEAKVLGKVEDVKKSEDKKEDDKKVEDKKVEDKKPEKVWPNK